jgi:hypothetical protein
MTLFCEATNLHTKQVRMEEKDQVKMSKNLIETIDLSAKKWKKKREKEILHMKKKTWKDDRYNVKKELFNG